MSKEQLDQITDMEIMAILAKKAEKTRFWASLPKRGKFCGYIHYVIKLRHQTLYSENLWDIAPKLGKNNFLGKNRSKNGFSITFRAKFRIYHKNRSNS